MKLRLQLAGMLPAQGKASPGESHGKGAFGTAMEEMMAESSGKPLLLVETVHALPPKQPQVGTAGNANTGWAIDELAGEAHAMNKEAQVGAAFAVAPHPQAAKESEPIQGQTVQHPDAKASTASEEPLPGQMKPAPIAQAPFIQNPAILESHAVSRQGLQGQSLAGATLPGAATIKDASSGGKHKADAVHDESMHPVDGLFGALPAISQPIELIIPIPVLQVDRLQPHPDGSFPPLLKSSSKAGSVRVRGQDASSRAPAPTMALSHGGLRGTPLTRPAPLTMPQSSTALNSNGGKIPESLSSNTNSESSLKAHPALQPAGKANTNLVPPNQALHPQGVYPTDSVETNGKQADPRTLKDAEKGIGTEWKPEVKASGPVNATLPPLAVQPPALPNTAPAATHGAEKAMPMHHPDTGAAQVLQRMDFAGPSGAVQLRADARRLDVGVSSGALGWVEVRATTGPAGRVDATLHVQNDASVQVLTNQSKDISDYAREHSVELGQVSVGVGTGDSAQGQSHSTHTRDGKETRVRGTTVRPLAETEQTHSTTDAISFISVRA